MILVQYHHYHKLAIITILNDFCGHIYVLFYDYKYHVFAITCSVLEYLNTDNKLSILYPILVRLQLLILCGVNYY